MNRRQYIPSKVRLWMVDNDNNLEIPVSSVVLRFGLNMIPDANVSLSIGVDAAKPDQLSESHQIQKVLARGHEVSLYAALEGDAGVYEGKLIRWPGFDKPFRVFHGRIQASSPNIHRGMTVSVGISHWLDDLESTHWLSSILSPGSLSSVVRPAGYRSTDSNVNLGYLDRTGAGSGFTRARTNLWREALKPSIVALANGELESSVGRDNRYIKGILGNDPPNAHAVKALERMDDEEHMVIPDLPLFAEEDNLPLLNNFGNGLGRLFWDSEGAPSLWSRLIRFFAAGQMALSPAVETATPIPLLPTMNSEWIRLSPEDIWAMKINARLPRILRGVILVSPENYRGMQINATLAQRNTPSLRGAVGFYDITEESSGIPEELIGEDPGMLLVQHAPNWLIEEGNYLKRPGDLRRRLRSVNNPEPGEDDDREKFDYKDLGDKMAKRTFMGEVFKYRAGSLTTRLRFDISPGSTISMEAGNPELQVPGYTPEKMMGVVTRVFVNISAEQSSCSTNLEISHLRTADEIPYFFMDEHPLFSNHWRGSPLVNVPGVTPPLDQ